MFLRILDASIFDYMRDEKDYRLRLWVNITFSCAVVLMMLSNGFYVITVKLFI